MYICRFCFIWHVCIFVSVSPPPIPVFLQAVAETAGSKSRSQWGTGGIATNLYIEYHSVIYLCV